jgi:hypothetical protein
MSEETLPPEPIKQFDNFSKTFYFPVTYTNPPTNTEYVDVTFDRFREANLNITIVSNNVTVDRTFPVSHDFGTEETPDVKDAFEFEISGFFGEELATNDEYVVRVNNEIKTIGSFGDLPDFNQPETYLIKFFPDSRHSVNVSFEFTTNATPANTFAAGEQEFELVPDRHVERITTIGNTIEARAAQERDKEVQQLTVFINSIIPDYPGKIK